MNNPYAELRREYSHCIFCGASTLPLEAHHITLRSQGGTDDISNLVLLCQQCHNARHNGLLSVAVKDHTAEFINTRTGEITVRYLTPQIAHSPSELVDKAREIQGWLAMIAFSGVLRDEPDEILKTLYQEVRVIKHRSWMVQAAIVDEMQSRSSYGEGMAKHVAEALGCSERTVQVRGQIYRDILTKPECSQAVEIVSEESFYREAVAAANPIAAINLAMERKIENPRYTTSQFRMELHNPGQESSLIKIVVFCREHNDIDEAIADKLQVTYGVPVEVVSEEGLMQVPQGTFVSIPGGAMSPMVGVGYPSERES